MITTTNDRDSVRSTTASASSTTASEPSMTALVPQVSMTISVPLEEEEVVLDGIKLG